MSDKAKSSKNNKLTIPSKALDFLKSAPCFITALAYRQTHFDKTEIVILNNHINSWQSLLLKHGVIYDGIISNGKLKDFPNLIYYLAIAIDANVYPAALPLVLDALYDLTREVPTADWQVYGIEQVITRFTKHDQAKCLKPAEHLFKQQFK